MASTSVIPQNDEEFIEEYYDALVHNPKHCSTFYNSQITISISGIPEQIISGQLMALKLSKIEMKSHQIVEFPDGGKKIFVKGLMESPITGVRHFMQTFILPEARDYITEESLHLFEELEEESPDHAVHVGSDHAVRVGSDHADGLQVLKQPSFASILKRPRGEPREGEPRELRVEQPVRPPNMEGPTNSICVKNLTPTIYFSQIWEKLKPFGTVLKHTVHRNTKAGYLFVDFEQVQSAQKAIQASPLVVAGRRLYVEAKRVSNRY